MKKICGDFGLAGMYKILNSFVNGDSVLKSVNLELKRGKIRHRSDALTRINALITERVDTSRVGAPDVGVECAGLKNEHDDRYGNLNPQYCFKRWNFHRDAWRSCLCPENSHLDAQSAILMG